MELMARIPGGRKSVLLFGGIQWLSAFDVLDYKGGVLSRGAEYAHAAIAAASRANIRIYPISPAGLQTGMPGAPAGNSLIPMEARALAAMTGGSAQVNSNTFMEAFARLVQETGSYYVLGFNSSSVKRNGRRIELEARVTRPGLRIRTRTALVEQLDYIRARMPREPDRAPVEEALANPMATPGMPMRAVAIPFRGAGNRATVVLAVELDGSGLDFSDRPGASSAPLDLRHLSIDASGRLYPEFRHRTTFTVEPDVRARAVAGGIRTVSQFELPPGRYQLRIAAGSGSRSGGIVHDLEIPDFTREPLALSGIAVSPLAATPMATLRPERRQQQQRKVPRCLGRTCTSATVFDAPLAAWGSGGANDDTPLLRGVLPGPPVATREFTPEETVALYAEVYDNNTRAARDAPYVIDVAARLISPDGSMVRAVSEQRESRAARRPSGDTPSRFDCRSREHPPARMCWRWKHALDVTSRIGRYERFRCESSELAPHLLPLT